MEENPDNANDFKTWRDRAEEKQNWDVVHLYDTNPFYRYLVTFAFDNYNQNDSSKEISLDPKSQGFTVRLIECCNLTENKFNVPSLVRYLNRDTQEISFYLYGFSEDEDKDKDKKAKLTLIDSLPELHEVDFNGKPFLLVSLEENAEIYREIIKKKAHTPTSSQIIASSFLASLIKQGAYNELNDVIKLQNDQIALLIAVSEVLKVTEKYHIIDCDRLVEAVTINDMDAAIRFAISQSDLLLFDFLEKKCAPIQLDADQKKKIMWLRGINTLQQQVKESFLPELLAKYRCKKEIKRLIEEQKAFITGKGSLFSLINQSHHHSSPIIAAVLSRTYYESNDIEKRKVLAEEIADQLTTYSNYQQAPLMAPLVYLLALNMLKGPGAPILTSKIREHRSLEIIITTDADVTGISSTVDILSSKKYNLIMGQYVIDSNYLSVAFDELRDSEQVMCTLLHEAAHLAANEVYQHNSKPYRKWDSSRKKLYQSVKTTLAQIDNWVPQNQKEWVVIQKFRNLLTYTDKDIIAELFVKVPEVIFILGYERGLAWLNQHVPDLLKLYQEEFLPDCLQYLKYRQINAHFSLDSSFSEVLKTTDLAELSLVLTREEVKMLTLSFVVLVCGIVVALAFANPITSILGLVLIAEACIPLLVIPIRFHQAIARRLAAMEVKSLPINNHPNGDERDSDYYPSMFTRPSSQAELQKAHLATEFMMNAIRL